MQNETELAAQLVGFLQQFFNVFAELKEKKFYLTGESVRFVCSEISLSIISFSVCWGVFTLLVFSFCVQNSFT
jgi:Serine carboxypeptidase